MASSTSRVKGWRELSRTFDRLGPEVSRQFREERKRLGEPVRADAERRARSEIPRIGLRWGRMRLGIRTSTVYVAPTTKRGSGSRRPNLAPLLMNEAMLPALDANKERIVRDIGRMLDRVHRLGSTHF